MEPQAPAPYLSNSDKDNTILIHDSQPPASGKNESPSAETPEQPKTFMIALSDKSVDLAESAQEDANKTSGTFIPETTST